jgi:hypothetical protein
MNRFIKVLMITLVVAWGLLIGCNVRVNKDQTASGEKNANITTPFGSLKVETNNVSPKDAGLQAYPGARLVPKEGKNDSDANVNIDTPWFGLRVVALKYESDDSPEKIWDFYKKDMSQYGKVWECKPGSPDLNIQPKSDDDISCKRGGHLNAKSRHASVDLGDSYDMELKAGDPRRLHVVGIKPSGNGTQFSLVYVQTRGDRESL